MLVIRVGVDEADAQCFDVLLLQLLELCTDVCLIEFSYDFAVSTNTLDNLNGVFEIREGLRLWPNDPACKSTRNE